MLSPLFCRGARLLKSGTGSEAGGRDGLNLPRLLRFGTELSVLSPSVAKSSEKAGFESLKESPNLTGRLSRSSSSSSSRSAFRILFSSCLSCCLRSRSS